MKLAGLKILLKTKNVGRMGRAVGAPIFLKGHLEPEI